MSAQEQAKNQAIRKQMMDKQQAVTSGDTSYLDLFEQQREERKRVEEVFFAETRADAQRTDKEKPAFFQREQKKLDWKEEEFEAYKKL